MIVVDKFSRTPIYEQIIDAVKMEILNEIWVKNETIPSVRSLSIELSINPNTIQKAYNELERLEITYSVPGVGRYVSEDAENIIKKGMKHSEDLLEKAVADLKIAGYSLETIIEKTNIFYGGVSHD